MAKAPAKTLVEKILLAMAEGVSTEFKIISPEEAKQIVAENDLKLTDFHNRPRTQVGDYAVDIAAARWLLNGDAIIFDVNGKLVDGRKRLLACIEAEVGFPTLVVRGISEKAARYIDQHKRRVGADVLHVAGFNNSTPLASAAVAIVGIARRGTPTARLLSPSSVLRFVEDEPTLTDLVPEARHHPLAKYFSLPDFVALLFLTRRVDRTVSDKFFSDLEAALAAPDSKNKSSIYQLARALGSMRDEIDAGAIRGTMQTRLFQIAYTTKVWNATRKGTPISRLKFDVDRGEAPPRLDGIPAKAYEEYLTVDDLRTVQPDEQALMATAASFEGVTAAIEIITPAQALQMLILNGPINQHGEYRNRSKSPYVIASYQRDMESDEWLLTGQSIKISESNRLIDGQHRLSACVNSGKPIISVVVRGLKDAVFTSFDTGFSHTFANAVEKRGVPYATTVQGSIRFLWQWLEYGLNQRTKVPTMAEMLNIFDNHTGIEESARFARRGSLSILSATPASVAGLRLICMLLDPKEAVPFFNQLESGEDLHPGMPILDLRRRFIRDSTGKRTSISQTSKMKLMCMTWNAHVAGTKVKLPGDVTNVPFPSPFDQPGKQVLSKDNSVDTDAPKPSTPASKSAEIYDLFAAAGVAPQPEPAAAKPKSRKRAAN